MYTVADPRPPRGEVDGPRGRVPRPAGAPASHLHGAQVTAGATRHVVTHVGVISVAKVGMLFFSVLAAVGLLAVGLLWVGAAAVGLVGSVEGFMTELGFQGFSFDALGLLRGAMFAGLTVVLFGTGVTVLGAILYNVVSDNFGGIEFGVRTRDRANQ